MMLRLLLLLLWAPVRQGFVPSNTLAFPGGTWVLTRTNDQLLKPVVPFSISVEGDSFKMSIVPIRGRLRVITADPLVVEMAVFSLMRRRYHIRMPSNYDLLLNELGCDTYYHLNRPLPANPSSFESLGDDIVV